MYRDDMYKDDRYKRRARLWNRIKPSHYAYPCFLIMAIVCLFVATYPVPYFKSIAYASVDIYRGENGSIIDASSRTSADNVTDQLTVGLVGVCWRNVEQKVGECNGGSNVLGLPGKGFSISMDGFPDIEEVQSCMVSEFTTRIFVMQSIILVMALTLWFLNTLSLGFGFNEVMITGRLVFTSILCLFSFVILIASAVIFTKFKICIDKNTQYRGRVSAGFWALFIAFGLLIAVFMSAVNLLRLFRKQRYGTDNLSVELREEMESIINGYNRYDY